MFFLYCWSIHNGFKLSESRMLAKQMLYKQQIHKKIEKNEWTSVTIKLQRKYSGQKEPQCEMCPRFDTFLSLSHCGSRYVCSVSLSFFLFQSRDYANYICKTQNLSVNDALSELVCQQEWTWSRNGLSSYHIWFVLNKRQSLLS